MQKALIFYLFFYDYFILYLCYNQKNQILRGGVNMAGFQPPINIIEAIERIKNNEYLLPAFQREYVWSQEQIERLFDSLMRGYPI